MPTPAAALDTTVETTPSLTTSTTLLTGGSLTATVRMAFGQNPLAGAFTWTDLSQYTRTLELTRGRQHELDQIEAATLALALANEDRRFDPSNTAGPYYPNVLPMAVVQALLTLSGVDYYLFTGFVERWPRQRKSNSWSEIELEAVDGFTILANTIIAGDYPQETTGARVNRVLDAVGWPAAMRAIDTGQAAIQAETITADQDLSALSHILDDVVETELGLFYVRGDGYAVFLDRYSLITDPYVTSQATFTDKPAVDTTAIPYYDITPSLDIDRLVNDWIGTRDGGEPQEALDSASIAAYATRSQTRSTKITADSEQLAQVQYLLSQTKTPVQRYDSLTVRPGESSDAWLQVLSRDLADRITIREHPVGGGAVAVQDVTIQQVRLTAGPGRITASAECQWQLAPADTATYVVHDDPTLGQHDAGNRIAY